MQKIDPRTVAPGAGTPGGAAAASRTAHRSQKTMAAPVLPPGPMGGGTGKDQQRLADATHRFSARRLRDSLPGKMTTRRLVLRAPMRGDVPDLVKLANNRNVAERLAILPHPYGSRDALAFITDFALRPGQRPYAITQRERLIGIVSLAFPDSGSPELGYWLGEPFWGQGMMSEAAKALVDTAFATGMVETLAAKALADNDASLGVLRKLGFVEIGEDISQAPLSAGKRRLLLELRRPRWM